MPTDEVATLTSGQLSWDYLSRIVVSILDRLSVYKRGFPDPSVTDNKLDLGPALSATSSNLTAGEASDDSCDSPTPPRTPLPHYFQNPTKPVLHDDKVGGLSTPETRWSSGVPFQPQGRYWRIGGEWYDFTTFADIHPGGSQILFLARDRFSDATYAFEAHHMNYGRARAIIQKYKLPPAEQKKLTEAYKVPAPKLLPDGSFYSDVRRRVFAHFKSRRINYRTPTPECFAFFWIVFICWCLAVAHALVLNPTVFAAICQGLLGALLGAFGHNFVHQPKYKWMAYLCLDTIGFSSDGWYREHVLQHHMYTNTPLDNHFKGTEPFLVTDPTVPRTWLQSNVTPYIHTLLLSFGVWANYITHSIEVYKGNEKFVVMKLFFPALLVTFTGLHGLWGLVLFHIQVSTLSIWYFTMALMNHNSETSQNVALRNSMDDWGSAQVRVLFSLLNSLSLFFAIHSCMLLITNSLITKLL